MTDKRYEIVAAPPHLRAIRKKGSGGGHVTLFAVNYNTLETRIFLVGSDWPRVDNNTDSGGQWVVADDYDMAFDDANGRITALTLHEVFDRFIDRWKERSKK
ncbi:hypothetical protein QUF64_00485 [Anaerolineales bacterium HSG6]|nr:hypothetical protein [Anaerolineales bacterium HSG6]MDM8529949.1 hypothetical protein [Anaerolineales bacterium HSG25]